MMDTDDLFFPELRNAAKRLELDEPELVEAMISSLGSGLGYWAALHSVVATTAQREGRYGGETKARIDSGDIFLPLPAPIPDTPGRMLEAVEEGRLDVFDALAITGARLEAEQRSDAELEAKRRRDARLAAVKTNCEA